MLAVDPNYVARLGSAIVASSGREQQLTTELSSGLRVTTLSDDAVAAGANVSLASSIARVDSFVQNASTQESRLQVTDTTLGEVVTQLTSATTLAVAAGGGTLNAANLAAITRQVTDIRDNVLSLANTQYLGTYLFSGSQGQTRPYTLNTASVPATTVYAGDATVQKIVTPDGQQLQLNVAGSAVFNSISGSVLDSLNRLVSDLGSGAISAIPADAAALSQAFSVVTQQRSTIGSSLSRLTATSTYQQTQEAQLQIAQTNLLSANPATVATELKTAEVQHQALISVVAALSQLNLFSYIK